MTETVLASGVIAVTEKPPIELVEGAPVRTVKVAGNPVEPNTSPLKTGEYEAQIKRAMKTDTLESYSRDTTLLVERGMPSRWDNGSVLNPIFDASLQAFDDHRPLTLSPDIIWLAIAQGFAQHINANAEALRYRFVNFEGKQKITLRRDGFLKGFAGNDWEGCFTEFSAEIAKVVGTEKRDLIVQAFSTTSFVEQAAIEVTLMDAMQSYFEYGVQTMCGIPSFYIEGEVSDWQQLRAAAEKLGAYDLDWWMPKLLPMLDEFVAASEGNANPEFWQSWFSEGGGSGSPYYGGEILTLFPYLLDYNRNPVKNNTMLLTREEKRRMWGGGGIKTDSLPCGLSVAPFTWEYYDQEYKMEFVAGYVGIEQNDETLALRPKIGWAIRDAQPK